MDIIETSNCKGSVAVEVCGNEKNRKEHISDMDTNMPPLFSDEEIEITIDSDEPIISISPTASKKDVSTRVESGAVQTETDPNKMNMTVDTVESSVLDSSADLDQNNTSALSGIHIPTDIFNDAFDSLTDIAVAAGIVKPDSPLRVNRASRVKRETRASPRDEEEEPGRIISASFDDEETQPFDEDENEHQNQNVLDISLPFDEMPYAPTPIANSKKRPEELSAIARIRYRQNNTDAADSATHKPTKPVDNKSYEEIRKEKQEKWRNLRQKATLEEAEMMQGQANESFDESAEGGSPREAKGNDSTFKGKSMEETKQEDPGFIDITMITKPLEDAWNQSQAALFGAVMGSGREREQDDDDNQSVHSTYSSDYDDDSCSSASSYYSEYDDDSEADVSVDRGRRSRRSRSGKDRDDSDSNDSDEDMDVQHSSSEGGNNRNFLDDITNEGINLTWHRPRSSPSTKELAHQVTLNIQISDVDGGGGHVEPNILWEIKEKGHSARSKYMAPSRRESISLFDISSIQKAADSIKLNSFPLADPFSSIMITLHDGSAHLFEAESASSAKKIIHGLRWIEARLTFNLIVGNVNVCSEMLSMSEQAGISELTSDIFLEVTNQLVEKSMHKLL